MFRSLLCTVPSIALMVHMESWGDGKPLRPKVPKLIRVPQDLEGSLASNKKGATVQRRNGATVQQQPGSPLHSFAKGTEEKAEWLSDFNMNM